MGCCSPIGSNLVVTDVQITSTWLPHVISNILFLIKERLSIHRGYLGPGGRAENGQFSNCTGGAAGYIDLKILTAAHIYGHPTCKVSN